MRENNLMALALLGVIIGASGLGFGAYSTMQVQTGAIEGKDGDDGDDGSVGKDGTIIGQVIQIVSNSTSDFYDINPATTTYSTLLSVEINVSADTNLFCIATIGSLRVYYAAGATAADLRLWLDDSIELFKATVYETVGSESSYDCYTIQNLYEGLSEGSHNVTLQYRIHPTYVGRIMINWDNAPSVLTAMEIA